MIWQLTALVLFVLIKRLRYTHHVVACGSNNAWQDCSQMGRWPHH
jgi:hypothetical protein